jgi:hypothetical protein
MAAAATVTLRPMQACMHANTLTCTAHMLCHMWHCSTCTAHVLSQVALRHMHCTCAVSHVAQRHMYAHAAEDNNLLLAAHPEGVCGRGTACTRKQLKSLVSDGVRAPYKHCKPSEQVG